MIPDASFPLRALITIRFQAKPSSLPILNDFFFFGWGRFLKVTGGSFSLIDVRGVVFHCLRRRMFITWKACLLSKLDQPTPTSLPVLPPRQKRLPISSAFYPSAHSSRPKTELLHSYGAKIEKWTPMHTWPNRHPQLACTAPHCFLSSELDWLSHGGTILGAWSEMLLHRLDSSPWPAPERVCLWLLDTSTGPPFYPICSKRVPIDWAWAEVSDELLKNHWSDQEKIRDTPQKQKTSRGTTPPPHPQFDLYIYTNW